MALGVRKGVLTATDSTQLQILLTMSECVDAKVQVVRAKFEKAKFCLIPSEPGEPMVWAAQSGSDVVLCYCPTEDRETWRVTLCSWKL